MHILSDPGQPARLRSSGSWISPFITRRHRPLHGHFTDRPPANPPRRVGVFLLMETTLFDSKFARIGARLKVADRPSRRSRTSGVASLDVQTDRKGEFFEIVKQPGAEA